LSTSSTTRLLALSSKKKLAFLLLVLERMIPQLRAFCDEEGRSFSVFEEARQQLWRAMGVDVTDTDWIQLRKRILDAAPDSEDFGTRRAGFALNAALVAAEAAGFAADRNDAHVADALTYARDTVDANAIGEIGSLAYNAHMQSIVSEHQTVQLEKLAEEEDIAFLGSLRNGPWPPSLVSELQQRAARQRPAVPMSIGDRGR
jgi:uncharacterized protein YjaG (DUF416 family)